jgi:hypothetical protein
MNFYFETGFRFIAQVGFELTILLLLPSIYQDYGVYHHILHSKLNKRASSFSSQAQACDSNTREAEAGRYQV